MPKNDVNEVIVYKGRKDGNVLIHIEGNLDTNEAMKADMKGMPSNLVTAVTFLMHESPDFAEIVVKATEIFLSGELDDVEKTTERKETVIEKK